jgi:hypothetical protein
MVFILLLHIPELPVKQLIEELFYYGISAIALSITGSTRTEGLRACVSLVHPSQFSDLSTRLSKFKEHHAVSGDHCLTLLDISFRIFDQISTG